MHGELARESDPDAELFLAFLAGFDISVEGYNGEYVADCHNVPCGPHEHNDEVLQLLRAEFDAWKRRTYG